MHEVSGIVVCQANECKVVNLRRDKYDVYIGRAGHGKDGYFGNPFSSRDIGRDGCIAKFREYFYDRIGSDAEFKLRVEALRGKTLGCFCSPRKCHGDIIAEYVNGLDRYTALYGDAADAPDMEKWLELQRVSGVV